MTALSPSRPSLATTAGRRRARVRYLGPNWYAAVMGTAIVANAGHGLAGGAGTRPVFQAVWALAAGALVALLIGRAVHWTCHADQARAQLRDAAAAPFHGCAAMALLAVGSGTLSVGAGLIGEPAAVAVAAVLWGVGTLLGLATAAGIPYLMITRHRIAARDAAPVWLLPVVAPMVSAASGPALAPWLPAGQWREALLLGCYALFGISLFAVLLMLPLIFARLLRYGLPAPALAPTLFLVLGPLGQSTTAAGTLADAAPPAVHGAYFAVAYGVPVLGFALLWLVLAGALVAQVARRGLPFAMTWWGFTFPVGTCVTGATGLARHTGLHALTWLAVGLYAVLVAAWVVVAWRTAMGLARGTLLVPPPASARGGAPVAGSMAGTGSMAGAGLVAGAVAGAESGSAGAAAQAVAGPGMAAAQR